jgi:hypothetical protein
MPPTDSPNTGTAIGNGPQSLDGLGGHPASTDPVAAGSRHSEVLEEHQGGSQPLGTRESASDLKEQARQQMQESYQKVRHFTRVAMDKAHEQWQESRGRVGERARSVLDQQKQSLCKGLDDVAQAAHAAADGLEERDGQAIAHYAHMAGDTLERVRDYVDSADVREIAENLRAFARRHPEIILGGMFVVGLAVARFVKADRRFEPRGRPPQGSDEGVWRDVYQSQFDDDYRNYAAELWDEDGGRSFNEPENRSGAADYDPSGALGGLRSAESQSSTADQTHRGAGQQHEGSEPKGEWQ